MMKIKSNPKGFTLIEIVISLGILAIGILAVLALFPVGFDSATRSSDLTKATIFAQDTMEEIKRIGYGTSGVVASSGTFSDPRFTYTVTPDTTGLPPNCQKITVRVTWNYKGTPHNEDFVTIISKLSP